MAVWAFTNQCAGATPPPHRIERGVALYEVDAEAGLHPVSPRHGDVKKISLEGHAYWVLADPIFSDGIVGARLERRGQRGQIWLRLAPNSRQALRDYTSSHTSLTVAIVLDNNVIDPVYQVESILDVPEFPVPEMDLTLAQLELTAFEEEITVKLSPSATAH